VSLVSISQGTARKSRDTIGRPETKRPNPPGPWEPAGNGTIASRTGKAVTNGYEDYRHAFRAIDKKESRPEDNGWQLSVGGLILLFLGPTCLSGLVRNLAAAFRRNIGHSSLAANPAPFLPISDITREMMDLLKLGSLGSAGSLGSFGSLGSLGSWVESIMVRYASWFTSLGIFLRRFGIT